MKVINIDGPDGNAFALLGYARKFANQLDLDSEVIESEMMAGDYNNLLSVFDDYFSEFVELKTDYR